MNGALVYCRPFFLFFFSILRFLDEGGDRTWIGG